MSELRASHSARRYCGLLLGVLLALGPVLQSVAAAQGPCGRAPVSEEPPAVEATSAMATGAQWTCPDRTVVSALRAVPSDRPDGPAGGGAASLGDEGPSRHVPSSRTGNAPVRPLISPVLTALRPVVLQI